MTPREADKHMTKAIIKAGSNVQDQYGNWATVDSDTECVLLGERYGIYKVKVCHRNQTRRVWRVLSVHHKCLQVENK